MDKLLTDINGGFPFYLDDFRWEQSAVRDAMTKFFRAFGDNYIIQGCEFDPVAVELSSGFIMLGGEILKVDTHQPLAQYFSKKTTYDPDGNKVFYDGSSHDTYQMNRAVADAAAGDLRYTGDRIGKKIADAIGVATAGVKGVVELASDNETQAGTHMSNVVTPYTLHKNQDWISYNPLNGWTGTIYYRKDNVGNVHIRLSINGAARTSYAFMALPENYRMPDHGINSLFHAWGTAGYTPITYDRNADLLRNDTTDQVNAYIVYST